MKGIKETIIGLGAAALLAGTLFSATADAQEWRRGYRWDPVHRAYIQWRAPPPVYAPVYAPGAVDQVASGLGELAAAPFNLLGGLLGGPVIYQQPTYGSDPCLYWDGAGWRRRC